MLSAFLIALREGVEASLIVGIILVYLSRTGRKQLSRYVWGGLATAVALSLAVAILLERWKISEDGFEGLLLLVAAFFVVTMIVWMNATVCGDMDHGDDGRHHDRWQRPGEEGTRRVGLVQ